MNGIMKECLVEWELNGIPQSPVLCSGQDVDALLLGRMITSGMVNPNCRTEATELHENHWRVSAKAVVNADADILNNMEKLVPNPSDRKAEWSELSALCDELMAQEHSAGLHSVLLSDGRQCVVGRDIGRHNALDIAVGKALRTKMNLSRTIFCTTARITLETLVRTARAGIPILTTRKPVGSLCVEHAEKLNIAVCRFGAETVCFSAVWRVI